MLMLVNLRNTLQIPTAAHCMLWEERRQFIAGMSFRGDKLVYLLLDTRR